MKLKLLACLSLLSASIPAPAAMVIDKPVLMSTGDSYTRRTGCTGTYDACDSSGQIPHEVSYATYLNSLTKYQLALSDNSARGGDTCTVQTAFTSGIFVGAPRGLVNQVAARITGREADVVSILLGINDVNVFGVSPSALQTCLASLYDQVTATGQKVVAMTYPPVATTTTVWAPLPGATASANVAVVNTAIRNAVLQHNAAFPARPVHLAETSTAWTSGNVGSMTSDGAHPNQAGALVLARKWVTTTCATGYLPCYGW